MRMGSGPCAGCPGRCLGSGAFRDKGLWENAVGQAENSYGLRARWCNWPPLRLARVRRERESVGVVLPAELPRRVIESGGGGGQVDRVGRASRLLPGRDRRRRPGALGGPNRDDAAAA